MTVDRPLSADRLTDGMWSAHGVWVTEHCAEQPEEPAPLFTVDNEHNAATVARIHNEMLAALAAAERRLNAVRELATIPPHVCDDGCEAWGCDNSGVEYMVSVDRILVVLDTTQEASE